MLTASGGPGLVYDVITPMRSLHETWFTVPAVGLPCMDDVYDDGESEDKLRVQNGVPSHESFGNPAPAWDRFPYYTMCN